MKTFSRISLALIGFGLALLLVTGCGTVHKVSNSLDSTTTTKQVESVKQRTVITEKADTNVTVKGDSTKVAAPIAMFLNGDTIEAETNGTKVKAWYDIETHTVHAQANTEDKVVPVQIDRTTVSESDSNTETESKSETEGEFVQVDKDTSWFSWWMIVTLISFVVLVWLFNRFRPRF